MVHCIKAPTKFDQCVWYLGIEPMTFVMLMQGFQLSEFVKWTIWD